MSDSGSRGPVVLRCSLEWWWNSWEDVIRILNTGAWLGSEGEQEEVDTQDGDEKHGRSGLLHADLGPGVGGRGWGQGVLAQLGSLDDQDLGEEDDVEDDDDDDGNSQEPITVTEIHPAVVIL